MTKPSLYACKFYMAWCFILPFYNTGILFGSFPQTQNDGPKIHSWFETAPEPSLYGITEITSVTFANFSAPCAGVTGPRQGKRDRALASMPSKANPADQTAPLIVQDLRTHAVDEKSLFFFHQTDPTCKCSSSSSGAIYLPFCFRTGLPVLRLCHHSARSLSSMPTFAPLWGCNWSCTVCPTSACCCLPAPTCYL
jgi:hypothetical protein